MIVLLDTSTSVCYVSLVEGAHVTEHQWQADRTLARHLLAFLRDTLAQRGASFGDLSGIGAMKGPGSFTGLRIGLSVANTLADGLAIPIVGTAGDAWQVEAQARLARGENDQIVLPMYSGEAHITQPRK